MLNKRAEDGTINLIDSIQTTMKYTLSVNNNDDFTINEQPISNDTMEEANYRIIEREEFINNLIGWIGEANRQSTDKDKALMKQDLKYLMSLSDKYLFSSTLTNEYIASSEDEERFNGIAEEMLS